MPFRHDTPKERRLALRHPSEREKGSMRSRASEQFQQLLQTNFQPTGKRVPPFGRSHRLESRDVEVLFHIDCESVPTLAMRGVRCRHRDLLPGDTTPRVRGRVLPANVGVRPRYERSFRAPYDR